MFSEREQWKVPQFKVKVSGAKWFTLRWLRGRRISEVWISKDSNIRKTRKIIFGILKFPFYFISFLEFQCFVTKIKKNRINFSPPFKLLLLYFLSIFLFFNDFIQMDRRHCELRAQKRMWRGRWCGWRGWIRNLRLSLDISSDWN